MVAASSIRSPWELVPIVLLLIAGGVIAVRSGVPQSLSRRHFRVLVGNASELLLRVLAYLTALFFVHEWVGMHLGFGW